MTRRTAVELSVLAVLAAAALILFLNFDEEDAYPEAMTAEEAAAPVDLPSWLSPTLAHPCEVCKLCAHRFEVVECRRVVTVIDRDGWYRLFWAGPETYAYEDAALVGGALRLRTAEFGEGAWTIKGRYVPANPTDPHPCPASADTVDLTYRLRQGPFPGPGDPALDPSGTLAVPVRFPWFRYRFPPGDDVEFWWELENPTTFAGSKPNPCACGHPVPEK